MGLSTVAPLATLNGVKYWYVEPTMMALQHTGRLVLRGRAVRLPVKGGALFSQRCIFARCTYQPDNRNDDYESNQYLHRLRPSSTSRTNREPT
jgi:hypothetical protein